MTQKKGKVQLNFLFQSLHNCEVRLWRRILVGPFPNNVSTHLYILDKIDIYCIIGNGPTLNLLYQEYVRSNSKEGNGPNKFLIHSTLFYSYEVLDVNEQFS